VRIDVTPRLFRFCPWPTEFSVAREWQRPHLIRSITPLPSRTRGVRPNHGGGRYTPPARAKPYGSLNSLRRCLRRPAPARPYWRKFGRTETLDGRYWPINFMMRGERNRRLSRIPERALVLSPLLDEEAASIGARCFPRKLFETLCCSLGRENSSQISLWLAERL
jgi:hypothetical protein